MNFYSPLFLGGGGVEKKIFKKFYIIFLFEKNQSILCRPHPLKRSWFDILIEDCQLFLPSGVCKEYPPPIIYLFYVKILPSVCAKFYMVVVI